MQQTQFRTPRTAAELERLRAQRQEITSQLEDVTERRGRLGQERLNARARGDLAMVQEYDGTIKQLGDRMNELSGQLISADKVISEAVANGVGERSNANERVITLPGGQQIGLPMPIITSPTTVPRRELQEQRQFYQQMLVAEGVVFVLLGIILARWAWDRGRRSAGRADAGDVAGLRNSVDAIAIEVERISENQRYVTKLMTEGAAAPMAKQFPEPMKRDISR